MLETISGWVREVNTARHPAVRQSARHLIPQPTVQLPALGLRRPADGARRVAAGYAATGGAAHGADMIEQRLLGQPKPAS